VKKEFLEEIEGDMEEIFRDNVEQLSYQRARWIYTWQMLTLFRPILMRNLRGIQNLAEPAMFRNYFKVSLRGLLKNPLNSFINVFGLAVAIGICVFAYAFARWTYSTDQFHEHKNSVYLATFFADRDGAIRQYGLTPRPLGEMLKQDFAQVRKMCRVEDRNVVVKHDENVFHERVRYADAEFLEMFTFPLKWGVSASLKDPNSIILSEKMSGKYFGEENPLGQSILVKFDKERGKDFKVAGVAKDFPKARSMEFDFLINFENFRSSEPGYDFHDWNAFVNATLIQVDNPSDLTTIEKGMEKYITMQHQAVKEEWAIASFAFEQLKTIHQTSDLRNAIFRSSHDDYATIIYLSFIGTFMLLLACFNYINIAIVSAARRLKEIGVRKSIGATRGTVIFQFLSENVVITSFAMIIGLILGATVFIPGFEHLWGALDLNFRLDDPTLWIYLPAILLITSIASGIYPSLYVSKFQVVGILKGSVKFGKKNPLTKVFLCMQLVLACVFITCAVMFTRNSTYLANRSWGYNQDETLYATVPDQAAFEQLSALMAQHPDVLSISGSGDHLGKKHTTAVLHLPDREYEVDQLSVDATYFETMGLEVKEGRPFNDHDESDMQAVVVNEVFVKNILSTVNGREHPVGELFRIDSIEYEVIGVVKDFHSYSFSRAVRPTIFRVAEKEGYRYLSMKVRGGKEAETYQALQARWSQLFPEIPFDGGHQEDVWGNYFKAIGIHGIVWRVFAFIAVTLAGLGLYGLITLNVAGRAREFSIRKVLGAGLKNIAANISGQYVLLFVIALAIGAPVSYAIIKLILDAAYSYHIPVDLTGVVTALSILLVVLLLTVSSQIRKVLKANPVHGLKVE